jgi:hypothetical protein
LDLLFPQDPEQLSLQAERQIADFIEKNGSPVGQFELSWFAGFQGSGERSCLVAEEFRFKQLARYGRAIDPDERMIAPGTRLMDGLGEDLLAGTALAREQNGTGECGQALGRILCMAELGALSDDILKGVPCPIDFPNLQLIPADSVLEFPDVVLEATKALRS